MDGSFGGVAGLLCLPPRLGLTGSGSGSGGFEGFGSFGVFFAMGVNR